MSTGYPDRYCAEVTIGDKYIEDASIDVHFFYQFQSPGDVDLGDNNPSTRIAGVIMSARPRYDNEIEKHTKFFGAFTSHQFWYDLRDWLAKFVFLRGLILALGPLDTMTSFAMKHQDLRTAGEDMALKYYRFGFIDVKTELYGIGREDEEEEAEKEEAEEDVREREEAVESRQEYGNWVAVYPVTMAPTGELRFGSLIYRLLTSSIL